MGSGSWEATDNQVTSSTPSPLPNSASESLPGAKIQGLPTLTWQIILQF